MLSPFRPLCAASVLFVGFAALVGCGQKLNTEPTVDPTIEWLARNFGDYTAANGRSPASEAEFKEYLQSLGKERLEAAGVKNMDTALVSPRDQQPYIVRYGWTPPADNDPTKVLCVIAEKVGKDGKRLVGFATGTVKEMDDAAYTAHEQQTPQTR